MDESLEIRHTHISRQFNAELQTIHTQVLEMGGLVQQQLADALAALLNNDGEIADRVIQTDHKVNAMEVMIDETCTHILARRQPAAGDLRMVIAVIKTITDLERIGDEAKRVARMAGHKVSAQPHHPRTYVGVGIEHMGVLVQKMLERALDSFARMDVETALAVVHEDEKVDREYDSIIRQLITYMMEDPRSIPSALDIMWSARALERIGDRSRNICEYVVYFVKGKDIRHVSLEKAKAEIGLSS